ncbi:hypothetical protein [Richelia intracellularis]|uniref:hypothetical protein n=1 Tax=Richelia intracellularis TaxID=1164990 RepID=UPI0018C8C368|nr:hypothetical protein [Richelia intracellularis]
MQGCVCNRTPTLAVVIVTGFSITSTSKGATFHCLSSKVIAQERYRVEYITTGGKRIRTNCQLIIFICNIPSPHLKSILYLPSQI